MSRTAFQPRKLPWMIVACLTTIVGCSFWQGKSNDQQATWKEVFGTNGPEIVDASRAPIETVILEVAHVEQPLNDLSLVDLLWKEIDQIGALDVRSRRQLEENGIRVGICGPNPPRLLESMMEVDAHWRRERTEGKVGSNEQIVSIFPGQPTTLFTGEPYQKVTIDVPRGSNIETMNYENAVCQFRVEAETIQEGWVKLIFIPEIHHGQNSLRRVATEDGWQMRDAQRIDTIYSQQFSITLNQGEMALLTATGPAPGSLGHAYFVGDGENDEMQRVVMIRLKGVREARKKLERER